MDVHICPICEKDQEEGFCEHFVATLCDDSDGFDVEMPIFFGWSTISDDHDEMVGAVHDYLRQIKELLVATAAQRSPGISTVETACGDLPGGEGEQVLSALQFIREYADDPDFDVEEDVVWELQGVCQGAFEDFYVTANGGSEAEPYEISHSPGLTWTGTDYWSSSGGKECARHITKAASEAKGRLRDILKSLDA